MQKEINTNKPELGSKNILMFSVLECFKPITNETHIWKSIKDEKGEWKKEKVSLSKREVSKRISDEIEHRRSFLFDGNIIPMITEVLDIDEDRAKKAATCFFYEFVKGGCKTPPELLLKLLDEVED